MACGSKRTHPQMLTHNLLVPSSTVKMGGGTRSQGQKRTCSCSRLAHTIAMGVGYELSDLLMVLRRAGGGALRHKGTSLHALAEHKEGIPNRLTPASRGGPGAAARPPGAAAPPTAPRGGPAGPPRPATAASSPPGPPPTPGARICGGENGRQQMPTPECATPQYNQHVEEARGQNLKANITMCIKLPSVTFWL